MKALSIKQPWAWLICAGWKDIENRMWRTNFRGRIYVHAGKSPDDDGAIWLWENKEILGIQGCLDEWVAICNHWKQSAIIGEVSIMDCVTKSYSKWFVGAYGFVLAYPVLYGKPIPCKGRLGFFEPDMETK